MHRYVGVTLALLLPATVHAQRDNYRSFGQWALGCDVARHCTALGTGAEDGGVGGFLSLARTGEAMAPLKSTVGWWAGDRSNQGAVVVLVVTGERGARVVDTLLTAVAPGGADADYRTIELDASIVQRLVTLMRRADAIVVRARTGDTLGVASLRGARAALLAMDETQRRLGTVTALARPGRRPAARIPAPPPLPLIRAHPWPGRVVVDSTLAPQLRKHLSARMASDCDTEGAETLWDDAEPLDATRHLVGLDCSRGAYNVSRLFWVVTNRDVRTARPALILERPGVSSDDGYLVNAAYDHDTGMLSAFAKGRGLGDCGSASRWAWVGDRFLLAERQVYYECRGVRSDWWPYTMRSRER